MKKKKKLNYGIAKKAPRKNLIEYIDFDYLEKLNEKELEYLKKFVRENYLADFSEKRKLTKTKEGRRKSYKANNDRNNDLLNYLKTGYDLSPLSKRHSDILAKKTDSLDDILDLKVKFEILDSSED